MDYSSSEEIAEDAVLDNSDSGFASNTSSSHQHSAHPQPASLEENVSSSNNSTVSLPDNVSSASKSSFDFLDESYTDEEVQEYIWMMDYDLKEEFHDILVLFFEDDENLVEEFCKGLNKILLKNKKPPKVIKLSDFAPEVTSRIKNLEFALERCTYIFLFLTKHFVNDTWTEFSGETCLMEAINNPEKRWCVVPVFTEPKRSCSFKIPPSLNSLKGVQYWNGPDDKFYKESVKNILDRKLHIRLRNEDNLMKKRRKWIKDFKTKKYFRQKQEEEKQKQQRQMLETRISSTLHSRCINKQQYETMYPCADPNHIYPVAESREDGARTEVQVVLQGSSNSQSYSETTHNSLDPSISEDAASRSMLQQIQLNQGAVQQNMYCNIPQTLMSHSPLPSYKPQSSASQSASMMPDKDIYKEAEQIHIHNYYYPPASEQKPVNIIRPKYVQIGDHNVVVGVNDCEESTNSLIEESDQSIQSMSVGAIENLYIPEQPLAATAVSAVSQDNLPSDRNVTYSPQTCVKNTGEPDLPNMAPEAL